MDIIWIFLQFVYTSVSSTLSLSVLNDAIEQYNSLRTGACVT